MTPPFVILRARNCIYLAARLAGLLVFAMTCVPASDALADVTIGGACTSGAAAAQAANGNNAICVSSAWQYPAYTFQSAAAAAGASCAGSTAGTVRYNSTLVNLEYCDGATWTALVKTTINYTAPPGVGYFVMSHGTWNGNLGTFRGSRCVMPFRSHDLYKLDGLFDGEFQRPACRRQGACVSLRGDQVQ